MADTDTNFETLKLVIVLIGAIAGIVSLIWRFVDEVKSYLKIEILTEVRKEGVSFLTKVENKGNKAKRIDNALLLVGLYSESPIETFKKICEANSLSSTVNFTNDFEEIQFIKPMYDKDGRIFIPLPFYYIENIDIADEEISYKAFVEENIFKKHTPYSVRFFIFEKNRLHRTTHNMFIFSEENNSLD